MTTLTRDRPTVEPATRPVRARRRRGLLWVVLALLLVALAVWWFALRGHGGNATNAAHATPPIPVLVAAAARQDVPIYLDGLGTVQASATVTVHTQVDGTLVQVLFREGQDVKQGEVLAKIDSRTYQASFDQAVAKKKQDEAMLANAKLDLVRYQKLVTSSYTSAQTADTQRATVAQDEAQVAQDQAQIDNTRTQLSYTTITAPIDGRAGIRQVDQGNLVHASDTTGLVVLTTLKPINVVFTLPQQQLPQVATAMAAGAAEVLALPQSVSQQADAPPLDRGTLAVLDNQVDSTTGTVKLKAIFPNEKLQLWPGGFVTVRLLARTDKAAVVVPTAAVQRGPQGAFVYVIGTDNHAGRHAVQIGHEDLGSSEVLSGLQAGERVVTDGAARLTDNATVTIAQPPGSAQVAPGGAAPASHRRAQAVSGAS